jgi:hypothetical protein
MAAYRITVSTEVDVNTAGPATRDELVKIGEGIALGLGYDPSDVLLASPIAETIMVSVHHAECQDTTHRRNRIDHDTYQCGAAESDAIHDTVEACSAARLTPCHAPAEHHAYVSPGFESPAEGE